eukprot:3028764-Rhodomonas_salina.6
MGGTESAYGGTRACRSAYWMRSQYCSARYHKHPAGYRATHSGSREWEIANRAEGTGNWEQ